jgi:hypothetical protein
MNADPADTRYPHLDLADLIAGATGQAIGDRAREHLASCEHCRSEAARWNLVADGVRGLAAAAPETAQPARPRRTGRRVPPGPWRRAVLVAGSAAAALVLLAGVGEVSGLVHVHLSGPGTSGSATSGPGTGTALTAVTGCARLEQADGTLEQVTTFVSTSGALLGDITDGASVIVRGSRSGGAIDAAIVTVGQPFSAVNPPGFVPVRGTVSDVSTAGFTLVTSSGTQIPVTTSGGTLVVVPHASLGQLPAGAAIFAVGHAGPDGTLSARAVAAIRQLPRGNPHLFVRLKNCSPASIGSVLAFGG